MKAGDTFRPADGTVDKFVHLWVIISDPEQDSEEVLIVSLTEYHPKKDTACILVPGDHPFIHKTSCVAYDLANAPSLDVLRQAQENGDLIANEPMRSDVLERIRKQSSLSRKMDPDLWDILDRQGLV
jgi:hypothetical protein